MDNAQPTLATRGGQLVNIVTWFLLAVSVLAVIARISAKRTILKWLGLDDALVVAALVRQRQTHSHAPATNLVYIH